MEVSGPATWRLVSGDAFLVVGLSNTGFWLGDIFNIFSPAKRRPHHSTLPLPNPPESTVNLNGAFVGPKQPRHLPISLAGREYGSIRWVINYSMLVMVKPQCTVSNWAVWMLLWADKSSRNNQQDYMTNCCWGFFVGGAIFRVYGWGAEELLGMNVPQGEEGKKAKFRLAVGSQMFEVIEISCPSSWVRAGVPSIGSLRTQSLDLASHSRVYSSCRWSPGLM